MSKKLWIGVAAACTALAVAGLAAAHNRDAGVQSATATFNATSVTEKVQATCTAGGDTYAFTRAIYTGTATSSDPRLSGPVTIRAKSLVDTTTGVGGLVGRVRIDGTDSSGAYGVVRAAISNSQAAGVVHAKLHGPGGWLLASLGSGFDTASGFSAGTVGAATTGAGAIFSGGSCLRAVHGKGNGHKPLRLKFELRY